MKQNLKVLFAIFALSSVVGCSSAPDVDEPEFQFNERVVEFVVERQVAGGDVEQFYTGNVHYVPNFGLQPYKYSKTEGRGHPVAYQYKGGVAPDEACTADSAACHYLDVSWADGVTVEVNFLKDDVIAYTLKDSSMLSEEIVSGVSFPSFSTTILVGTMNLEKDSGLIHEALTTHLDKNGEAVEALTRFKYRFVK